MKLMFNRMFTKESDASASSTAFGALMLLLTSTCLLCLCTELNALHTEVKHYTIRNTVAGKDIPIEGTEYLHLRGLLAVPVPENILNEIVPDVGPTNVPLSVHFMQLEVSEVIPYLSPTPNLRPFPVKLRILSNVSTERGSFLSLLLSIEHNQNRYEIHCNAFVYKTGEVRYEANDGDDYVLDMAQVEVVWHGPILGSSEVIGIEERNSKPTRQENGER